MRSAPATRSRLARSSAAVAPVTLAQISGVGRSLSISGTLSPGTKKSLLSRLAAEEAWPCLLRSTRGLSGRPPSPRMGAEPVVPPGRADGRGHHLPSPQPAARVSWRRTHSRTVSDRPGASQCASDRGRTETLPGPDGPRPTRVGTATRRVPLTHGRPSAIPHARPERAPPSDETRAAARRGLHRGGRVAPGCTSAAGRHRADAARRDPCRHDGHGDHRLRGDDARTLRRTCARGTHECRRPAPPPHRGADSKGDRSPRPGSSRA